MLAELLAMLETGAFEEFGSLRVISLTDEGSNRLTLGLDVQSGLKDQADQRWDLRCGGVRAYGICHRPIGGLVFLEDHPLLYPYREPKSSLYFSGSARSVSHCIAALWDAHDALLGDWYPFTAFLNIQFSLRELLDGGHGLLAEGPNRVVESYAQALQDSGLRLSQVGQHPPMRWDGEQWRPESPDLKALILDRYYVVAEQFEA